MRHRGAAALVGLGIVALAFGWAEAYPSRAMLVVAEPLTYRCGTVLPGSFGRHPWEIRNVGARAVRIRTYFTGGRTGFSLWQRMTHVVEPGGSLPVHLTYAVPGGRPRAFEALVILRTDDPEHAEVRFRVVGTSGP